MFVTRDYANSRNIARGARSSDGETGLLESRPSCATDFPASTAGAAMQRQMTAFTNAEIICMKNQHLRRLATAGSDGQPHVVPAGFHCDAKEDAIEIGEHSGFAKRTCSGV
jgi:hypothetical protein